MSGSEASYTSIRGSETTQYNSSYRNLLAARQDRRKKQQKHTVKSGNVKIYYTDSAGVNKEIDLPELAAEVAGNSADLDWTIKNMDLMIKKIIDCVRQELKGEMYKN
jgi:hypothetical protein